MAINPGNVNFVTGDLLTAGQYNTTHNTLVKTIVENNNRLITPVSVPPSNISPGHWLIAIAPGEYINFPTGSVTDPIVEVESSAVVIYLGNGIWNKYDLVPVQLQEDITILQGQVNTINDTLTYNVLRELERLDSSKLNNSAFNGNNIRNALQTLAPGTRLSIDYIDGVDGLIGEFTDTGIISTQNLAPIGISIGDTQLTINSAISNKLTQLSNVDANLQLQINNLTSVSPGSDWNNIINKPTNFPPSPHSHTWTDITDVPNMAGFFELKTDSNGDPYIEAKHSLVSVGGITAYSTGASIPNVFDNLPIASASVLGCIKIGANLTISEDGTVSASAGGSGVSSWNELTDKPSTFPPSTHSHPQSEINNTGWITTALSDKLGTTVFSDLFEKKSDANGNYYIQAKFPFVSSGGITAYATNDILLNSIFNDMPKASALTLGGIKVGNNLSIDENGVLSSQAGGVSSWEELTGKPTSFPPNVHTHSWSSITDKPITFPSSSHSHSWASITDKPGTFLPTSHQHAQSDINNTGWITNAIGLKLNATTFNDLFEKVTDSNGNTYIRAKMSLVSDGGITAYGTGPAGSIFDELPIATSSTPGVIKIGDNLSIDGNGVLSAQAAGVTSWSDLEDKPTRFDPTPHVHEWSTIENKPSTYPPSIHNQHWNTLTAVPAWLSPSSLVTFESSHGHDWDNIKNKPSKYSPSTHSHTQSQITNIGGWITTALEGKQPVGSYLTTTGTAADSSKLGGIVAGNYYHSGNANRSNVNWTVNNLYSTRLHIGTKHHIDYNTNGLDFVETGAAAGRIFIKDGGNVGIGTTSPETKLHVSGNILATGEVTAYSDRRLKSNIMPLEDSLDAVMGINPVRYTKDGKESIGVIAQELKELFPELVTEGEYLSVNYAQLTAVLIKAIQELKNKIDGTTK